MNQPTICTIIAKNYLAAARVLCTSFLAQHPDGKCFVLVVDHHAGFINPAEEVFTLVGLEDLALPEPSEMFCFKYGVVELATAVKPYFLRYLVERRGVDTLLYLDPDILVTGSLTPLYERLRDGGGLLLTPHLDTDIPADGLQPDESFILVSGAFNLGFLGLRAHPGTMRMIGWLEHKLRDHCVVDLARGYFVDQKFFDLAVSRFPEFEVERGVGYNVAYWNLHGRTLSREGTGPWLCNGEPLRFFHFSNYKPERPDVISGHLTRLGLADRPDLAAIFAYYRAELLRFGYEQTRRWPYTFACFESGLPITHRVRTYYHRCADRQQRFGNPFRSRLLRYFVAWRSPIGKSRALLFRLRGR